MIIERSKSLIELLDQKKSLKGNLNKIKGFRTRRDEIIKINKRLKPLATTSTAFRTKNIGSADVEGRSVELEETILNAAKTLKENPEDFTRAHNFKKLQEGAATLSNDLEVKLNNMWFNYTRSLLPDENTELLDVLDRLPSFSSSVRQIRQINSEIATFRDGWPLTEEDIEKFNGLADKMKTVWDGIEAVPPDILAFLQNAVSSSGASIDLLTDEVRKWLAEYKINASFKVRLS